MTAGLPDFYRGIDITYQSLSQITSRPKYGEQHYDEGTQEVTANDITVLLTVTGKGMTYGGLVFVGDGPSLENGKVQLLVDGNLMSGMSFALMNKWKVFKPDAYPIYLLRYDDAAGGFCVGISRGITFETSIVIRYVEADGGTPIVVFKLTYAII